MKLFDDLLRAPDYDLAVQALAADFRRQHALPPLSQLGLVVHDVEQAAAKLETHGVAPCMILQGAATQWRERGRDLRFSGTMALVGHRGIELEPLAAGVGSDFYRQMLDPAGGMTIHHLGFHVPDVDAWAARLVASTKGRASLWVRGRLAVWPTRIDFAYVDALAECGFIIEFISCRIFGLRWPGSRMPFALESAIGRLQKAIGVRSFKV